MNGILCQVVSFDCVRAPSRPALTVAVLVVVLPVVASLVDVIINYLVFSPLLFRVGGATGGVGELGVTGERLRTTVGRCRSLSNRDLSSFVSIRGRVCDSGMGVLRVRGRRLCSCVSCGATICGGW